MFSRRNNEVSGKCQRTYSEHWNRWRETDSFEGEKNENLQHEIMKNVCQLTASFVILWWQSAMKNISRGCLESFVLPSFTSTVRPLSSVLNHPRLTKGRITVITFNNRGLKIGNTNIQITRLTELNSQEDGYYSLNKCTLKGVHCTHPC